MTVLTVCQDAAPWIGLEVPTQIFAGTVTRDKAELKETVNEAAFQIAQDHDWTELQKIATLNGDGTSEDFSMPSDFDRMVRDAKLWSSENPTVHLTHILSADLWLAIDVQDFGFDPYGAWIEYGGQMHIKPAPASGETVKFFYVSDNKVNSSGGSAKASFTADDDTFVLNERLLKLALIWMWRAKKRVDYEEDMMNYQIALSQEVGKNRGPATLAVGKPRWRGDFSIPYPKALGS